MPTTDASPAQLNEILDRLSRFEPGPLPVLSLYLNLRPDHHGRDSYGPFLRKEFKNRIRTYPVASPARQSLMADVERVNQYLATELEPSANGLALFACSGAEGFFEAVQLAVPIEEHRLYIDAQPHVYPLARLDDQFPRYAALLADTNSARLFVFSTGRVLNELTVQNVKTRKSSVGGWSQARYQRHLENYHLLHAKEVVAMLERVVRTEKIPYVILACDEVVLPLLRDQLPPHVADKIVDVMHLDISTPDHEVLRATIELLRHQDAKDDVERVNRLYDAYRSGGLGVVTAADTLAAIELGQVEELLISATLDQQGGDAAEEGSVAAGTATPSEEEQLTAAVAEELVTKAKQTDAKVTFIENAELLREAGGVGALLRYRL